MTDLVPLLQGPVRDLVELKAALGEAGITAELVRPPGSSGNG